MKNLILNSLICDTIIVIIIGGFGFIKSGDITISIYVILIMFFSLALPIFLFSAIQLLLKKIIRIKNHYVNVLTQILFLNLAIQIGLVAWVIIDIIMYYGNLSKISVEEIRKAYDFEFYSYQIFALAISILIPIIDWIRNKRMSKFLTKDLSNRA